MIDQIRQRHNALAPMTRGALGFILAVLMFNLMDVGAKTLVADYPTPQLVWARYAAQTGLMVLIFLPSLRQRLKTEHLSLQLIRSLFLFAATGVFFTSFIYLELATAAAVFATSPLIITILSAVILKEQVGPRRWIAVLVGLTGVLIILRPGFDVFQIAALLPALAATFYASYQIATRWLGATEPIWTTLLYTTGVGTVLASFALPFFWVTPSGTDALIMLSMGAFGLAGHVALVYALNQAPASALAPFNYMGFVWASIVGFIFFAEIPDAVTVAGAAVIISAGIYVWHRERVRARQ
ncbi:MAG: DMT family transporter [Pseudomonadota bacterium]